MPRVALTTIAIAVLLVSACITIGYLALLHTDALPVPRADGRPDGTKALQRLTKALQRAKLGQSAWANSSGSALQRRVMREDPCSGLELVDRDEACKAWATAGECEANPDFMLQSCQLSCHSCRRGTSAQHADWDSCKDQSSYCGQWAAVGECDSNPHYMRHMCRVTCHLCQSRACHDADAPRCKAEAEAGVCYAEPERMYRECRWACRWCAMSTNALCVRDKQQQPAVVPGTLERMFARAVSDEHARFRPRVLSRQPWVVAFDSFLSEEECDRIIAVGGKRGFSRSMAGDGVQAVRTSSTSWCSDRACQDDPTMRSIRERIANLTMVPAHNAEHLQVLRYEPGQFYKVHHDQNSPRTSAWGPRIYTFFMYLNEVEAGGHTHFPRLNVSVKPRRGAALLWPSVLDADPNERDDRTEHEAVAVVAGTKFAANYWLHMWDFQQPTRHGCGNTEIFGNW